MSRINVIFAIDQVTANLLKQNFQRDADGNRLRTDLTDSQAKKLRTSINGHWNIPNIAGKNYTVISWYVPDIYADTDVGITSGLKWVEFLLNKWANKFHIIGAWNRDGSMFGTTIVPPILDENGNEITPETVIGTPVYLLHPQFMKIFPDVDEAPALIPSEINNILGWSERRWV